MNKYLSTVIEQLNAKIDIMLKEKISIEKATQPIKKEKQKNKQKSTEEMIAVQNITVELSDKLKYKELEAHTLRKIHFDAHQAES